MYQATLRIDHGSPYAAITGETDATVEVWCNQYCDLLHVTGSELDPLLSHLSREVGITDSIRQHDEVVLITDDCLMEVEDDLVETHLQRHGCLSLPPLIYDHGTLRVTVVSPDEASLTAVYRDVSAHHDVTVRRKQELEAVVPDVPLLTLNSPVSDLSAGQREALLAAIDGGYYEIPRGTTTAALADSLDISRRTYEEHLRRAEQKLVVSLGDYLRP